MENISRKVGRPKGSKNGETVYQIISRGWSAPCVEFRQCQYLVRECDLGAQLDDRCKCAHKPVPGKPYCRHHYRVCYRTIPENGPVKPWGDAKVLTRIVTAEDPPHRGVPLPCHNNGVIREYA